MQKHPIETKWFQRRVALSISVLFVSCDRMPGVR
jgi:hypothetical protein